VTAWLGALTALLLAVLLVAEPPQGAAQKKRQKRPNIVVVMTDDQDFESVRVMRQVRTLLAHRGVTFKNSFANTPLCCPSRATFLTGQHARHHRVLTNLGPFGGYDRLDHSRTLPVWLRRAGYHTGHVGRYLNGYGEESPDSVIPPGWDEWYAALEDPDCCLGGTLNMYGYTLNENGRLVTYGQINTANPANYQTDVYSRKAVDFIRRSAPERTPFFLSVATLAPHDENEAGVIAHDPRPAPRHAGAFLDEPLPRPPSFNEADVSDKPEEIQALKPLGRKEIAEIEARYRDRLASLLAVDEMVEDIVAALRERGELDDTVIVFTSDNGFFHGQHRIQAGKLRLYEESIRVPLIIRGPGVPENKRRRQIVSNIDLAPTILDYANANADRRLDGRSLVPLMRDKLLEPGRGLLAEARDESAETRAFISGYAAVRTGRYIYGEHSTGERELYDLLVDPFELQNRHGHQAYGSVEARLNVLLERLERCAGKSCAVRPALKMRLRYQRARRPGGGRCLASGVRAKVVGADRGFSLSARFFVNGRKAGVDRSRPLRRKVGRKRLPRRRFRLRSIVSLLEGRDVTLTRRLPPRCG
jgi:arylsulfatase A-like enzyme